MSIAELSTTAIAGSTNDTSGLAMKASSTVVDTSNNGGGREAPGGSGGGSIELVPQLASSSSPSDLLPSSALGISKTGEARVVVTQGSPHTTDTSHGLGGNTSPSGKSTVSAAVIAIAVVCSVVGAAVVVLMGMAVWRKGRSVHATWTRVAPSTS